VTDATRAEPALYADGTRIIHMAEILKATGVSRATVYNWLAAGRFPKPVLLGGRTIGWRYRDVAAWLEKQPSRG
jgi:prophage regulatory protein